MLAIFYQTLDNTVPKWQQGASLIGSNPGMKNILIKHRNSKMAPILEFGASKMRPFASNAPSPLHSPPLIFPFTP